MKIDIYSITLIVITTLAVTGMIANLVLYIINDENPMGVHLLFIIFEAVIPMTILIFSYRMIRHIED